MRRSLVSIGAVLVFAVGITASASAQAKDYAATALNIIPSGQYGALGSPARLRHPGEDVRRPDAALRPGHPGRPDHLLQVRSASASTRDGPSTVEAVPRAGVTIERDSFNVPHVTGATHDDGVWAAGWIAAEDRGLLLQQARYNARVAAIDAPGLSAIGLISGLQNFQPSAADRGRGRQADPGARGGRARRARRSCTTSTSSSAGSTTTSPTTAPRTRRGRATTCTR